ncbi:MAG: LysR family transcriptional regulator [Nevskiaceae bacterium]|nr:MAG: LysR family transcriptional regulator [Nevskiaceae bacterium]TBR74148.1 MAG: LysR family transcriptional regulator [Nevskiaceae bacterium]
MAMNLHHLAVFHAVAELGSVSAAARVMHISQPAVSRELKALEDRLSVRLFERRPRGMRLTEAGALLEDFATRIFTLERGAESAVRDFLGVRTGSLEIGASHTLGTYLLPRWIAVFARRYPDIHVALDVENTAAVARGVREYRYAFGFIEGPAPEDGLEVVTLAEDEVVPVVAGSDALAQRPPETAQALADVPVLLREEGSGTRLVLERNFHKRGLQLRCVGQINSAEALLRAVEAGAGVAWLSRVGVAEQLASGRLVQLPAHGLHVRRQLRLVRLRERYLSPAADAFVKLCLAQPPEMAGEVTAATARMDVLRCTP